MKKVLLLALSILSVSLAQAQYTVTPFVTGLSLPVGVENCGDSRMFIIQKRGLIRIANASGVLNSTPFLNLTSIVSTSGNERGLLGLAFHPNFKQNGYFYVNYTAQNDGHATHVSRFQVNPNDSNQALANSELILLDIPQPYSNHNGGNIEFGPDGYLYIGMGDGGSANDPDGYGQNLQSLLGKMLRIDVDNPQAPNNYGIPADNPFVSGGGRPEIWSYGLRNPWKFSFDKLTGDMWIGDVGQNAWEEIDYEAAGTAGGRNYGWRCYEGNVTTSGVSQAGCPAFSTTAAPVFVYSHASGNCSVTGGVVYRGSLFSSLYGKYLCVDYCTGFLWEVVPNGLGGFTGTQVANLSSNLGCVGFGEDMYNELYFADDDGIVYKLTNPSQCNPVAVIQNNDTVGVCNGASASLNAQLNPSLSYQWYLNGTAISGATQSEYITPNAGNYAVVVTNPANSCTDTAEVVIEDLIVLNPAVQVGGPTDFCEGSSVTLTYLGGPPFQWNTGDVSNIISVDSTGSYSVSVSISEFCETTSIPVNINVFPNPAPPSFSGLDTSYCFNLPLTSTLVGVPAGGTFSGPGVSGNTFDPAQAGIGTHNITYTITDANNCSSQQSISTMVDICAGVENLQNNNLMVYPNPGNGVFYLNTPASGNLSVRVSDMKGRVVWMNPSLQMKSGKTEIDLRSLNQGIYIIEVNQSSRSIISIQH